MLMQILFNKQFDQLSWLLTSIFFREAAATRKLASSVPPTKRPDTSITNLRTVHGTLSEDEALARALAESMQTSGATLSQDDQDRMLAEAIAASEEQQLQQPQRRESKSCSLS